MSERVIYMVRGAVYAPTGAENAERQARGEESTETTE